MKFQKFEQTYKSHSPENPGTFKILGYAAAGLVANRPISAYSGEPLDPAKYGWNITHIRSGMRPTARSFKHLRDAKAAIEVLAARLDWNVFTGERTDPLFETAKAAARELEGLNVED